MTRKAPVCAFCESSDWKSLEKTEHYEYKGQSFDLDRIEYAECIECGFEVILPIHAKKNEPRIRDEHRKIDGLLTSSNIRTIRKALNLTQAKAATLLGGGVNAFSKYERGEVTQSHAMDCLLRILHEIPDAKKILSGIVLTARKSRPQEMLVRVYKDCSRTIHVRERKNIQRIKDFQHVPVDEAA